MPCLRSKRRETECSFADGELCWNVICHPGDVSSRQAKREIQVLACDIGVAATGKHLGLSLRLTGSQTVIGTTDSRGTCLLRPFFFLFIIHQIHHMSPDRECLLRSASRLKADSYRAALPGWHGAR